MSERQCVLCEQRERYELDGKAKQTTWSLVRRGYGDWAMCVVIENIKLGVAMMTEVPIEHCPECGKELL